MNFFKGRIIDFILWEVYHVSRTFKKLGVLFAATLLGLQAFGCSSDSKSTATSPSSPPSPSGAKRYSAPPPMQIDVNKKYTATIETDKGDIVIELFSKDALKTVNNFVFLAREGFYNGTTFHRVIPGFMAQGGDPTGTGAGGPGYKFEDEFSSRGHVTGSISMANAGPGTNGSQFFICYAPQPGLDGKHSVFGQVTKGMDVLNRITPRDPTKMPTFKGDTIVQIKIAESP
jgi:cyclophilin family peptidyl-prolyl cis-trans isomerase